MSHSTHVAEVIATRMPADQAGVRVVRRQTDASQLAAPRSDTKYDCGMSAMKL